MQLRSPLLEYRLHCQPYHLVAVPGSFAFFGGRATFGCSGLAAGPCRRWRRSDRTRRLAEGTRALPAQNDATARLRTPATLPWMQRDPTPWAMAGRRFYVICEADRSFRAISSGHGGGRNLKGIANFANGKRCAQELRQRHGLQADDRRSLCDERGDHVFQGILPRLRRKATRPLSRSFVQFDGEGETANARPREIGGHAAVLLRGVVSSKEAGQPVCGRKGLRSVRDAGELLRRAQQRLHQLVAGGRRANHPHDEGQADDALHLP